MKRFSQRAFEEIETYPFPGNVRELKNLTKNAVVISESDVLENVLPKGEFLPLSRQREKGQPAKDRGQTATTCLSEALLEVEREKLKEAIRRSKTTREMARYSGISQSTVTRKLNRHSLKLPS